MPAITQGYKLVQALKGTGTGVDKIKVCQAVLVANRQATSADIIAALEADITVSVVTIDKAKQLAATGKYDPAVGQKAAMSIEDQIAAEEAAGGVNLEEVSVGTGEGLLPSAKLTEVAERNSVALAASSIGPKKVDGPVPTPPSNSALPS